MKSTFSDDEVSELIALLKEKEKTEIACIPQIMGIWLHDSSWHTELRLLVLPRMKLTVSRVCFQNRRQGIMTEVLKWMKRYCRKHSISRICIQCVETKEMANFCNKNGFAPEPTASFEMNGIVFGDYVLNID